MSHKLFKANVKSLFKIGHNEKRQKSVLRHVDG